MKLVKLSLVAAMAAGVFATTASAAPLEEVIKDVDVSGQVRLRYTHDSNKPGENKAEDNKGAWNFKGELNLKSKIDDNFFMVLGLRYEETDKSTSYVEDGQEVKKTSDGSEGFKVHRAYLGYNYGGTTIQVGRQDVGAFFTDDMYGDGVKILNSDIEGLTLAALWMDSLEYDDDILAKDVKFEDKRVVDHNLYGVAAIGSYDPVSFQLWYAVLEDVTDLFAVELAANFDVTDDFSFGLRGQYAFSDFDSKFKTATGTDDGDFYGIEATTNFFGVDFSAGYVDFSTDEDKLSLNSFEDDGAFIIAGEELIDYALYKGENKYWFVTAGYTIPNTGLRLGVDYVDGERTYRIGSDNKDFDMSEFVARIDYKYNDKLKFKAWYSHVKDDGYDRKANKGYENDRIRFEAKYSF